MVKIALSYGHNFALNYDFRGHVQSLELEIHSYGPF